MRAAKQFLILVLLAALLSSCAAAAAPAPTPTRATAQVLAVQITPTLRGLSAQLSECARRQWTLGLVIDERAAPRQEAGGGGLALRWGPPNPLNGYAVEIGKERLVVVVHPDNPVTRLNRAQVRGIYTGSIFDWGSLLKPACESCAADRSSDPFTGKEIHAWAYVPGEDIRQLFETAYGMSISHSAAGTAPHGEAARQAVAEDPQAIAFLPARLVDGSVRTLKIEGVDEAALTAPLLAIGSSEPQGLARQWLACVQEQLK